MSSTSVRVAAVAAAAIGVTVLAACSSSTHTSATSTPKTATAKAVAAASTSTTIELIGQDEAGNMAMEDLGAKSAPGGADLGDLLAFTQTLTREGKAAGEVHVVAVGVDHKRKLSEASGTIVLSDGSIQVAGIVTLDPTFTLTVVGGTGAYAGDTGTFDFDGSGAVQKMTVHLTR